MLPLSKPWDFGAFKPRSPQALAGTTLLSSPRCRFTPQWYFMASQRLSPVLFGLLMSALSPWARDLPCSQRGILTSHQRWCSRKSSGIWAKVFKRFLRNHVLGLEIMMSPRCTAEHRLPFSSFTPRRTISKSGLAAGWKVNGFQTSLHATWLSRRKQKSVGWSNSG